MLRGEEINMAVCQPASQWEQDSVAEVSVPCQQSTLPEIKGRRGPEGKDVDVSIQRPHFGN